MSLKQFLGKQFIAVIQWNEPGDGILAYRYPMQDMEIQSGGQLTVRESQLAAFVNEGKIADVFGPGLHTLNTRNLPLLTELLNWDKDFESPFKSDVYFFRRAPADRAEVGHVDNGDHDSRVGKEFGAVRLRGYGIYSYRGHRSAEVFHPGDGHTRSLLRVRAGRANCAKQSSRA